ncbi:MAG: hypothetical protein SGJ04_02430 [Bacteroidota bacterium]|nr:hypothetical protein [Bacteroidota bacterium]
MVQKVTNPNLFEKKIVYNFFQFMWMKDQRPEVIFTIGIFIIHWLIYSWAYPNPLTLPDSESYVISSYGLESNLFRPIGYSWFLKMVHFASTSVSFLLFLQSLFTGLATLFVLQTIKYHYPPTKQILLILLALVLCFSQSVHMMNMWILSDSIFYTLALIYVGTGIWLIKSKGSIFWAIFHAFVIALLIFTRHAGLFFAVGSIVGLLFSLKKQRLIAISLCTISVFIVYTATIQKHKRAFGEKQYSGFSGWNLLNSSMSIYQTEDRTKETFSEPELQAVHQALIEGIQQDKINQNAILNGLLLWQPKNNLRSGLDTLERFYPDKSFAQMYFIGGKWFGKYAQQLIIKHPDTYIQNFVLPNLGQFFCTDTMHRIINPALINGNIIRTFNDYFKQNYVELKVKNDFYKTLFAPIVSVSLSIWFSILLGVSIYSISLFRGSKTRITISPIAAWLIAVILIYVGVSAVASFVEYRYIYFIPILIAIACYFIIRHTQLAIIQTED